MCDNIGERIYELHFYECYDECLYLSECEIADWFDELKSIFENENESKWFRLQRIIACVTLG